MALIPCPDCDGQISDKASACPHCGAPMKKTHKARKPRVAQAPQVASTPENPAPSERSFGLRLALVCVSIGALALLLYSVYALHSMPGTLSESIPQLLTAMGKGIFIVVGGLIAILFVVVTVVVMLDTGTSNGGSGQSYYSPSRYWAHTQRTFIPKRFNRYNKYSTTYNNTYVNDYHSDGSSYDTDSNSNSNDADSSDNSNYSSSDSSSGDSSNANDIDFGNDDCSNN
jgi:hypothetical protein